MLITKSVQRTSIHTVTARVDWNGEIATLKWDCLNHQTGEMEDNYVLTRDVEANSDAVKQQLVDVIEAGDQAGPHFEFFELLSNAVRAYEVAHSILLTGVTASDVNGFVRVTALIDSNEYELDMQLPLTSDSDHVVISGAFEALPYSIYQQVGLAVQNSHERIQLAAYAHGFDEYVAIEMGEHTVISCLNATGNRIVLRRSAMSDYYNTLVYERDLDNEDDVLIALSSSHTLVLTESEPATAS